jgi:hypothetical protein
MYINVGATADGRFLQTKKALRHALLNEPERVKFFQTSAFTSYKIPPIFGVERIEPDWVLSVVGPDPSRSRKWYATVTRLNGTVRIE